MEESPSYYAYWDPETGTSEFKVWRNSDEGWVDVYPPSSDPRDEYCRIHERVERLRAQLRTLGVEPDA